MSVPVHDYWPAEVETSSHGPVRVAVLMHGRGANRQDLGALRGRLPRGWHVVLPDAPHPAAAWGYGPGRAWYRYLGEDHVDGSSMDESLGALDDLLAALPSIVRAAPTHVVMGGFSQGGTMGHAYALSRPGAVHGVINLSGFLPSSSSTSPETVRGCRFFWGHGLQDMNIPFSFAERGRAALRAAGAELESRDYAIGHWIDPDELRDVSSWLNGFELPA